MPRRIHQTASEESRPSLGGKGDPVIGADAPGQAVLAEEALEDRASLHQLRAGERLAGEQQTAVSVGHGEGEAVLPVAQLELALVVGGPHGIGGIHRRAGWSR
jgi:hypothetical protein